jgi:hypothetical protein
MPFCREAICEDVRFAILCLVKGERNGTPEKGGDTVPI